MSQRLQIWLKWLKWMSATDGLCPFTVFHFHSHTVLIWLHASFPNVSPAAVSFIGPELQLWCQQATETTDRRAGEQKQVIFSFVAVYVYRLKLSLWLRQQNSPFKISWKSEKERSAVLFQISLGYFEAEFRFISLVSPDYWPDRLADPCREILQEIQRLRLEHEQASQPTPEKAQQNPTLLTELRLLRYGVLFLN